MKEERESTSLFREEMRENMRLLHEGIAVEKSKSERYEMEIKRMNDEKLSMKTEISDLKKQMNDDKLSTETEYERQLAVVNSKVENLQRKLDERE